MFLFWIKDLRSQVKSIPLLVGIIIAIIINAIRKLIPPLYYFFPFGTLQAMYLVDKQGAAIGAMIYQLLKLQDLIYFILLQKMYKKYLTTFLNLNVKLRKSLIWIDDNWKSRFIGKSLMVQGLTIIVFGCTLYWDDYISLIWFALSSEVKFSVYAVFLIIQLGLEYFKTYIKMQIYVAALDTVQSKNESSFSKMFSEISVFHIIFIFIVVGFSTLYVHGFHIYFVIQSIKKKYQNNQSNLIQINQNRQNISEQNEQKELQESVNELKSS